MSICLVMPLLHSPDQQRANFLCKVRPCAPLGVVWPGTRHKVRWGVGIILGSWEGRRKGEGGERLPGKDVGRGAPRWERLQQLREQSAACLEKEGRV